MSVWNRSRLMFLHARVAGLKQEIEEIKKATDLIEASRESEAALLISHPDVNGSEILPVPNGHWLVLL